MVRFVSRYAIYAMPSSPILYSFRRCPYAMRARMALLYSSQRVELREVVLKNKPAALLEISPKGTVPVLQLEDGRVLEQSLDIMYWALRRRDPEHWLMDEASQKALISDNDEHFKPRLDRYKYADRHPGHSEQYYREQCFAFLDVLEARLQAQSFLFGEQVRLADIAIFPFIRQFAHVDANWFEQSPWRGLQRWLSFFKQSSIFTLSMHKYPAWTPGDAAPVFPPALP